MKYGMTLLLVLMLVLTGCTDSVSESQSYPGLVYIGISEEKPAFHDFELRNPSRITYYYYVVLDSIVVYEMMVKQGEGWTSYPTYFGDMPAAIYSLTGKQNLRFQVFPPRGNLPYRIAVGLYGADKSLKIKLWSNPVEY
jgi:hypothetical protein